jgi:hypothetical protein
MSVSISLSDHPLGFVHPDPSFHRHKADVIVVLIHVRFWSNILKCALMSQMHLADVPLALRNVRFEGEADIDQTDLNVRF